MNCLKFCIEELKKQIQQKKNKLRRNYLRADCVVRDSGDFKPQMHQIELDLKRLRIHSY